MKSNLLICLLNSVNYLFLPSTPVFIYLNNNKCYISVLVKRKDSRDLIGILLRCQGFSVPNQLQTLHTKKKINNLLHLDKSVITIALMEQHLLSPFFLAISGTRISFSQFKKQQQQQKTYCPKLIYYNTKETT